MHRNILVAIILTLFVIQTPLYEWKHDYKSIERLQTDIENCMVEANEDGHKYNNTKVRICLMLKGWKRVKK